MKNRLKRFHWEARINTAMIIGFICCLLIALSIQIIWNEPPCPLCLLQRAGFSAITFGLLLNLRFGFKPLHYSVALVSGLFTMAVSLRQIALHIIPGTAAYGSPMFGLHLYTWAFIASFLMMLVTSAVLGSERQYTSNIRRKHWITLTHVMFAVLFGILIANMLTTMDICGFGQCPDDPIAALAHKS